MRRFGLCLAALLAVAALTSQVQATAWTLYGPMPYLQTSDSPFIGLGLDYFYLEDFEDFALNTPGVTASAGYSTKPTWPAELTDSVDGDDGVVDGFGTRGNSWFSLDGGTGVTFTFDALTLGSLPTHVGVVWTDGIDPIRFAAYDSSGTLVGQVDATGIADGVYTGTTGEDRFFGMIYSNGISKITLASGVGGGIELDHLQYGGMNPIPAPGAVVLASLGAALSGWLRRRRML